MRRVERSLFVALSISIAVHGGIFFFLEHMTLQNGTRTPVLSRLTVTLIPFSATDVHAKSINPAENAPTADETKSEQTHPPPSSSGLRNLYAPSIILDAPPTIVEDITGDPASLAAFNEGGKSILILRVGEDGTVTEVDEEFTDLPSEMADEIRDSFFQVRFRPGTINGKATKFFMRIETKIKPKGNHPSERFAESPP